MAKRLATRGSEIAVLQRICELGFGAPGLAPALDAIVGEISSWSGFPIVAVELFDEQLRRVVPAASVGVEDNDVPLAGTVALTGKPFVETDVLERPERASPGLLRSGIRTVLCMPMTPGGDASGALVLADRRILDIPDTLVDLAASVADHLGELIVCMRAEEELQESRTRLALLTSVSTGVRSGMSVGEVIDLTIQRLAAAFPQLRATYSTIDPAGALTVVRSAGPEEMSKLDGRRVDLTVAPGYLASLRAGETVVSPDVADDPRVSPLIDAFAGETKALLDVPLRLRDDLVGLLCLDTHEPHTWSGHELATLTALADYLSIALEDASSAERLRAAEEKYRGLVEELPLVTYIDRRDDWSSAVYVSPQIERLLGYSVDEWLDDRELFVKVIHPDDRERVRGELREEGERFRSEYRLVAKDGHVVWVQDEARQELDPDGEATTLRGYLLDITERKELEERLREAHKLEAVGRLAGGIAHEFNNLNAIVAGYAELLGHEIGTDSPLVPHVRAISAAAARSAGMIEQLMAFSQRGETAPEPIDLNEVVHRIDALLIGVAGDAVELVLAFEPSALVVKVDERQLQEVVLALVENAREAMPQGGTLRIATARADEGALLTVSDTGVGMDERTRRLIFEPFFTTRDIGEGPGLGLAFVHGAVERSGGRIEVESHLGRGTTFRIFLPLALR